MKKRVLFICSGNTCRSQMAEAMVNARFGKEWEAFSAGTHPEGSVRPKTLSVLAEIGIQHTGKPKSLAVFRDKDFDLVVTMCDSAAQECPTWSGKGKLLHYDFIDPALSDDIEVYRTVRDDIGRTLESLLESHDN